MICERISLTAVQVGDLETSDNLILEVIDQRFY